MKPSSDLVSVLTGALFLAASNNLSPATAAAPKTCFSIRVVDEQTGRGVPLVELKTVNDTVWWTDSAGIVAFDEPGLIGQEVFFHVSSPGYEYPKDFFDNRGVKLRPRPGGNTEIRLKRLNIAERLYRITGAGIYRDSAIAGRPVPLKQPLLNAQVMGQDTVIATPYRGKIYWFWGDTERASYPLGNFAASGATSDWPGHGGLDPSVGVDLTYFADKSGFSKPMCTFPGPGLKWIEGVFTLRDSNGTERLVARVSSQKGLAPAYEWNLCVFNDAKQVFESITRWDWQEGHDSAHPFRAGVAGVDYLYLYPNCRVRADFDAIRDSNSYEAFTCVAGDGKCRGAETAIDRDAAGRARYSWKAGADRLHSGRLRELLSTGTIQRGESWLQLRDMETAEPIGAGRGSVFWNEFLRRWVMIISGKPGEVWFSQSDTPTGPWVYARRVVTHGRYNFYNPTQHPFFDQEHGRVIYFEGTYTDSFSDAPAKTPRYNYNQIMYRLALDDARLNLPVPVYRVRQPDGTLRHWLREGVEEAKAWEQIEEIAFFALAPGRRGTGLVPVYSAGGTGLQTNAPALRSLPLFLALSLRDTTNSSPAVRLYDVVQDENRRPLCRVWKNTATTLALDFRARP